jgi:hypothetical protein
VTQSQPNLNHPLNRSALHTSYRAVFLSPDGQAVLNHLATIGYVNDATYVANDTHETAHREGMRRIVISILRFVDKDPQELLNLEKETTNE